MRIIRTLFLASLVLSSAIWGVSGYAYATGESDTIPYNVFFTPYIHFDVSIESEMEVRFFWDFSDHELASETRWLKLIFSEEYDPDMYYDAENFVWYAEVAKDNLFDAELVWVGDETGASDGWWSFGVPNDAVIRDHADTIRYLRLCAITHASEVVCDEDIIDMRALWDATLYDYEAYRQDTSKTENVDTEAHFTFSKELEAALENKTPVAKIIQTIHSLDTIDALIDEIDRFFTETEVHQWRADLDASERSYLRGLRFALDKKQNAIIFIEEIAEKWEWGELDERLRNPDLTDAGIREIKNRLHDIENTLIDLQQTGYESDATEAVSDLAAYVRALIAQREAGDLELNSAPENENIQQIAGYEPTDDTTQTPEQDNQQIAQKNIDLQKGASQTEYPALQNAGTDANSEFDGEAFLGLVVIALAGIGVWTIIAAFRRRKKQQVPKTDENTPSTPPIETVPSRDAPEVLQVLRIFKASNEAYNIEYGRVYERSVKVLEENKHNLIGSVHSFVASANRFADVRSDTLDRLANFSVEIPDLETSGKTMYRLFFSERMRNQLAKHSGVLVIRTDEQEVPWEIMHDGEDFLALHHPIVRDIVTGIDIRTNPVAPHTRAKMLIIVDPTEDLPGTRKETEHLVERLHEHMEITVLRGKDATATQVFSLIGRDDWDIIHYAGHARFDEALTDESGLVLSWGQIASVTEIRRSLGGNPVVFLNACASGAVHDVAIETPSILNVSQEQSVGIATAFLSWGARGVMATLWPVSDEIASAFSSELYLRLVEGDSIAYALLSAKRHMRHADASGVTWASFVYYGDPESGLRSMEGGRKR